MSVSTSTVVYDLPGLKNKLWKGIPMSKESAKEYKYWVKTHHWSDKWDMIVSRLTACAERDRREAMADNKKCGVLCGIKKKATGEFTALTKRR